MAISNSAKAGLVTTIFAFIGVMIPSLVGWLNDLAIAIEEAAKNGGDVVIPEVSTITAAAVSAVGATIGGVLNWAFRAAQEKGIIGAGDPPLYGAELVDDVDAEILERVHAGEPLAVDLGEVPAVEVDASPVISDDAFSASP